MSHISPAELLMFSLFAISNVPPRAWDRRGKTTKTPSSKGTAGKKTYWTLKKQGYFACPFVLQGTYSENVWCMRLTINVSATLINTAARGTHAEC